MFWQRLAASNTERCGWWCDNAPRQIADVIDLLYSLPQPERIAMGQRGRQYILNNFTADRIAAQMQQLYQWLGGEGAKPDFVY